MFVRREFSNDFGVDELGLLTHFLPILNPKTCMQAYGGFKAFIASKIKRELSPEEESNLKAGIAEYAFSKPNTNERNKVMEYLFTLKFLKP